MSKPIYLSKNMFLGISITVLLGFLFLTPPLQGAAEIIQIQQQPDHPKPGVPFEIPGNGSSLTLTPREELILETPSGVSIQLIVGESVDISVIESTDLPEEARPLPEEAQGLGQYLSIELSDSEVDMDAIISMPYTDGDLPPGVAADQLFFAFYEAATGEWRGVPSWVDTTKNVVYTNTDHFSTWTVMSTPQGPPIDHPKPGVPFEIPGNGSSVYLIPGEQLILQTPSGVSINLTVGESINISVIDSTDLPAAAGALPEEAHGLGRYLTIELSDSAVDVDAIISMPYNDGDLPPGVAADQLYFAFYEALTGEWRGIPSWVDTKNGMVYAETTHFSIWTVLGETESTSPSTTLPQLWLIINNVKDGFLISFTVLSLFLAVVALINRRQK